MAGADDTIRAWSGGLTPRAQNALVVDIQHVRGDFSGDHDVVLTDQSAAGMRPMR